MGMVKSVAPNGAFISTNIFYIPSAPNGAGNI